MIEFKGTYRNTLYRSDNFAIIAFDVNKWRYPNLNYSDYGNVVVTGEFPPIQENVEYELKVEEVASKKYGKTYKLTGLSRELPTSREDILSFLSQVLTDNQAREMYNAYPDIVDRIKENRLGDIDLSKMKGITENNFNNLVAKINSNLFAIELISWFDGSVSLTNIHKLLQRYGTVEMVKAKLKDEPYKCLCGLSGIGFKKADDMLLRIQESDNSKINFNDTLRSSKQRCKACVIYSLQENEQNGNTKIKYSTLKDNCFTLVPEAISFFDEVLEESEIFYDQDTMCIALSRTFTKEHDIVNIVFNQVSGEQQRLFDYEVNEFESLINIDGVTLTDQQIKAIANVIENKVSIINGVAGSGKSYCTKAIIKALEDKGVSYLLCAPTGKSAKVLSGYTNRKASTIHRALGYNPSMPYPWTFNKGNPLRGQVIIVDEFSMVDVDLFWHLLDAVDFRYSRLLLIGDNAQLPSVSCGNLLHDFLTSNVIPTSTLDKVFRYQDGGLMAVATDVRTGKKYLCNQHSNKITVFGNNSDYVFLDVSQDSLVRNLVKLYSKLLAQGNQVSDIQVLTAKNVGRYGTKVLNNELQHIANPNCGSNPVIEIGDTKYYEGDIVLQTQNNYEASLLAPYTLDMYDGWLAYSDWTEEESTKEFIANGEVGVIKKIVCLKGSAMALIDFDGIEVLYSKNDLLNVSLGYAMTIHKSQGSSSKITVLSTTKSDTFMLNSNLMYVGMTRARDRCYHLGQVNVINNSIKKKANFDRDTWTVELFQKLANENYT